MKPINYLLLFYLIINGCSHSKSNEIIIRRIPCKIITQNNSKYIYYGVKISFDTANDFLIAAPSGSSKGDPEELYDFTKYVYSSAIF